MKGQRTSWRWNCKNVRGRDNRTCKDGKTYAEAALLADDATLEARELADEAAEEAELIGAQHKISRSDTEYDRD